VNSMEEQLLLNIIDEEEWKKTSDLQYVIKGLRRQCGKFSETEALLHMMDALIAETAERKGW